MYLKFMDLRRYAIDQRVEIRLIDSGSGRVVVFNTRGQARIPNQDRDFRVEDIIGSADRFEVTGEGKPESFSREKIAAKISEHFKARGFTSTIRDEEE